MYALQHGADTLLKEPWRLADFDDDRVVDANDYAVVLRDLGKVANSMGDMASMKDGKMVIGIPDGKVDNTDVVAFEQEMARYEALRAAIYAPQDAAGGETPLARRQATDE